MYASVCFKYWPFTVLKIRLTHSPYMMCTVVNIISVPAVIVSYLSIENLIKCNAIRIIGGSRVTIYFDLTVHCTQCILCVDQSTPATQ